MDKERIDEALELLWLLDEEERSGLERFRLNSDDPDFDELLGSLKTHPEIPARILVCRQAEWHNLVP